MRICLFVCLLSICPAEEPVNVRLKIEHKPSIAGKSKDWDWWHARTAAVPQTDTHDAFLLTTMSESGRYVSHDFHDIFQMVSLDHGQSWTKPAVVEPLKRRKLSNGYEVAAGDMWPTWHAKSGKVLITGKTFNFENGKKENNRLEQVSWAVLDPATMKWSQLQFLELPEKDHSGAPIIACNAGNNQRVDLPNGDILLPIRYWRNPGRNYVTAVARCSFDGTTLKYVNHGTEMTIESNRGLYEPSLTEFKGAFFLTMRADKSGWVARSSDGQTFEPIQEWKFDDGRLLGSYNTQQHWITTSSGLFLVYTRRGADNDHIFRHRAPLFIAQVDPATLRVIRKSERILLPENQATLGNSGICRVSDTESWVTCGEGLLRLGERKKELNKVLFVKVTEVE